MYLSQLPRKVKDVTAVMLQNHDVLCGQLVYGAYYNCVVEVSSQSILQCDVLCHVMRLQFVMLLFPT